MPRTNYIWDEVNDTLLAETDEAGNTIVEYTHEPGPFGPLISQRRNGHTFYHHYDGQGSTRALTNESGNVTDRYTYSAFGEPVASSGSTTNPFGYKGALGYYANPETNDRYVRRRTYAPTIGRWLSLDPLEFSSNDLNMFRYTFGSPLSQVDPTGMFAIPGILPLPPWVACFGLCVNQFWAGSRIPPSPEGFVAAIAWSEMGSCRDSPTAIHVVVYHTTYTPDPAGDYCHGLAEQEIGFKKWHVDLDSAQTCTLREIKRNYRGPHATPPNCSSITFGWDCRVDCKWRPTGSRCNAPSLAARVYFEGSPESLKVKPSLDYRGACCRMFPCNAQLSMWETGVKGSLEYTCWDFESNIV